MTIPPDLTVDRLRRVIDILRVFDTELPAQVISVLFYVASHEGCTTQGLPKVLGLAQSSISRTTDWLSHWHRLGKPGMGLIRKEIDLQDRRLRRLYLTKKGRLLIDQIKEIVWDDH